jgi:hypothetical protein
MTSSVMTYACPAWELAADTYLSKLHFIFIFRFLLVNTPQLNNQLNSTTELNSQLLFASRYIGSGRTSQKTRVTCQNVCLLARY